MSNDCPTITFSYLHATIWRHFVTWLVRPQVPCLFFLSTFFGCLIFLLHWTSKTLFDPQSEAGTREYSVWGRTKSDNNPYRNNKLMAFALHVSYYCRCHSEPNQQNRANKKYRISRHCAQPWWSALFECRTFFVSRLPSRLGIYRKLLMFGRVPALVLMSHWPWRTKSMFFSAENLRRFRVYTNARRVSAFCAETPQNF